MYSSPPSSEDSETISPALRATQSQSPQSLVTSLHVRSPQLFTPSSPAQRPSSAFLPHQILHALVLSSLSLGCYDVGRRIIEEWLASRTHDSSVEGRAAYAKVLKLYCTEVLPRMEEWEYAQDFLRYEGELDPEVRRVSVFFAMASSPQLTTLRISTYKIHCKRCASGHCKVDNFTHPNLLPRRHPPLPDRSLPLLPVPHRQPDQPRQTPVRLHILQLLELHIPHTEKERRRQQVEQRTVWLILTLPQRRHRCRRLHPRPHIRSRLLVHHKRSLQQ